MATILTVITVADESAEAVREALRWMVSGITIASIMTRGPEPRPRPARIDIYPTDVDQRYQWILNAIATGSYDQWDTPPAA